MKRLRLQIPDAGVRGFLLKSLHQNLDNLWQWRFDLPGLTASYDAIRRPPEFTQPVTAATLFVKGGASDYLGAQDELVIRTHFNDPHFKEIGGAGHWLHAEKPALFTRICHEFMVMAMLRFQKHIANPQRVVHPHDTDEFSVTVCVCSKTLFRRHSYSTPRQSNAVCGRRQPRPKGATEPHHCCVAALGGSPCPTLFANKC